jgi:hypothetical protein
MLTQAINALVVGHLEMTQVKRSAAIRPSSPAEVAAAALNGLRRS